MKLNIVSLRMKLILRIVCCDLISFGGRIFRELSRSIPLDHGRENEDFAACVASADDKLPIEAHALRCVNIEWVPHAEAMRKFGCSSPSELCTRDCFT